MVVVCINQRAQVDQGSIFLMVYTTGRARSQICQLWMPVLYTPCKREIKAVSKFRFRTFLVMSLSKRCETRNTGWVISEKQCPVASVVAHICTVCLWATEKGGSGAAGQRGSGAAGQRGSGGGGGVIQLLLIRESEWRYLDNTITHNFLAL